MYLAQTTEIDAPVWAGEVLHQLAKTIQLMRLDHADAHLYRHGCDALVRHAVDVADRPDLAATLGGVMRCVELGDYHAALKELRSLAQSEWHAC